MTPDLWQRVVVVSIRPLIRAPRRATELPYNEDQPGGMTIGL